ncbi:MAG TPA: hypothetical protein DD734_03605 [Firmicutes bacterium]|nr:hypothetical protein [Bacillota bacterium]HBR33694.1 hypothetical protein [Bacillota bacterium]
MKPELRSNLTTILFCAFSIIAVFFLLDPLIAEATDTLTVNSKRIYLNVGWIKVYFATLLVTFILIILLMDKKQIWVLTLGLVLGSIPVLDQYRVPGLGRVVSVFQQNNLGDFQTYIPYLAVILGIFLVLVLLKVMNKVLK